MKTYEKVQVTKLAALPLKGIEIVTVSESSAGDLKEITLRDTVTNTHLRLSMGGFSDFTAYSEKQPKMKEVERLVFTYEGAACQKDFDSEVEMTNFITRLSLTEFTHTHEKVEVNE